MKKLLFVDDFFSESNGYDLYEKISHEKQSPMDEG